MRVIAAPRIMIAPKEEPFDRSKLLNAGGSVTPGVGERQLIFPARPTQSCSSVVCLLRSSTGGIQWDRGECSECADALSCRRIR